MRIRVLGDVHIDSGENDCPEIPGQVRRVLAILACNANRAVDDDLLVGGIWDDIPPRSAVTNLRGFVSRLRRLLEPDVDIERHSGAYLLRLSDGHLDSHQFEELSSQAEREASAGDLDRARDLYRRALDLWRGPAYGALASLTAVRDEAKRLNERRLSAVEDFFDLELILDSQISRLAELHAHSKENPYRARLKAQLMAALFWAGRRSDALKVFRETLRAHNEEFGQDPCPELHQLNGAILAGDSQLISAALRKLARSARESSAS